LQFSQRRIYIRLSNLTLLISRAGASREKSIQANGTRREGRQEERCSQKGGRQKIGRKKTCEAPPYRKESEEICQADGARSLSWLCQRERSWLLHNQASW
jgi:hypothetical protein